MTSPEVWNKPTPTAPLNAIPTLRKQGMLLEMLFNWKGRTSDVMPFEAAV
jgi:hypothetical protein